MIDQQKQVWRNFTSTLTGLMQNIFGETFSDWILLENLCSLEASS